MTKTTSIHRIQRKRTKGWRMPANAVYVGRPSRWGNDWIVGVDNWPSLDGGRAWTLQECLEAYRGWLKFRLEEEPEFLDELKGKNLACWCSLDQPCHADIILKVLNR